MRSAIANNDGKEIYISEAKHNLDGLSLYIRDHVTGEVKQMPPVSNLSGEPSGGTVSKSSREFHNGTAFSLADLKLFGDGKPSLLRYQLKKASIPVPSVRVPSKKKRSRWQASRIFPCTAYRRHDNQECLPARVWKGKLPLSADE